MAIRGVSGGASRACCGSALLLVACSGAFYRGGPREKNIARRGGGAPRHALPMELGQRASWLALPDYRRTLKLRVLSHIYGERWGSAQLAV